jgi:hypothetical protein
MRFLLQNLKFFDLPDQYAQWTLRYPGPVGWAGV